jgi:malate dehydrogenase (oxaloacetate-decarboxylating)
MSDETPTAPAARLQPSASYSFTMRLHAPQQGGAFARVAQTIADADAMLGAIDLVRVESREVVRDVTVACVDSGHAEAVVRAVRGLEGVRVDSVSDRTFLMHKGGKIEVNAKLPLKTRDDLSMAYTPGVARVSMAIHEDPAKAWALTIKSNTVAVVSDGTAVLGLGDIGPAAAMPVMEGKAMLFKEFAGVDAFPLCIDTKDVDEIVAFVTAVAPTFGGINLEDIAAPRCFEIERRLRAQLDIPVFHDDQHGTAIVVLAALRNALRCVGKRIEDVHIAVSGGGAAGSAIVSLLLAAGAHNIVVWDREGILNRHDTALSPAKHSLAERTNPRDLTGTLRDAVTGADVFIGVSAPNLLAPEWIDEMASQAIVFALANPDPEVDIAEATKRAAVVASGRSDYPNQINNVLAFPGVFRGLLDARATQVTTEMLIRAADALASVVTDAELNPNYIVPSVFGSDIVKTVAAAIGSREHESSNSQPPDIVTIS